jgi:hypothetical protein
MGMSLLGLGGGKRGRERDGVRMRTVGIPISLGLFTGFLLKDAGTKGTFSLGMIRHDQESRCFGKAPTMWDL